MCSFQENMFLLCPYEEISSNFETAHGNFLIFCELVFLPNINFLISKQDKTKKIDPNMLKQ